MEVKLLTSALTRLDELPLRLVETESHGSPWHELASSNVVKQAMQLPGFVTQVKDFARKKLAVKEPNVHADKPKPTASTVASDIADDRE